MTTSTWTAASGNWNNGAFWSAGVPTAGDVAVINDSTVFLTGTMVTGGTLDGVTLDLNPTTALFFNATDVAFGATSTIDLTGPMTLDAIGQVAAAGHATIGSDTTAATLTVNISKSNTPLFTNSGSMDVISPVSVTLDSVIDINPVGNGATFSNAGAITLNVGSALNDDPSSENPVSGFLVNSGTLAILGDGVTTSVLTQGNFTDAVRNTGTIIVDGGGTVDPALTFADFFNQVGGDGTIAVRDGSIFFGTGDADTGGAIQFSGALGNLDIFDPTTSVGATLRNFGFTDQVHYFTPISGVVYAGGTLTVNFTGGGSQELRFANPAATDFVHSDVPADLNNGQYVVSIACFRAGTRILTGRGELPVEHLRAGDRVVTVLGRRLAPVRWVGHRRISIARHPRPDEVLPVRVQAHAFGAGMPHRDLWLSPDHAVHVDGALIPVRYLVNGMTIAQREVGEISYFHVELDRHEVLLAEGLPAESYLDTGNRCAFANGGSAAELAPDFAPRAWDALGCAPLVLGGEAVTAVRHDLRERALRLGFAFTDDPALHLSVGGQEVWPTMTAPGTARFVLPAGVRKVRIRSRASVPAELGADLPDHRRLGVPLAGIRIGGRKIALDDPRLGEGLHSIEADGGWRWTDGDAVLWLRPGDGRTLELVVPFTTRYAISDRERAGTRRRSGHRREGGSRGVRARVG
jgi:hypothetical protein